MPSGIAEPLLPALSLIGLNEGEVIVDIARNDVKMQTLCRSRPLIHELCEAFRAGVGQPLVNGQAVAFRLRDFLPIGVEKKFVIESFRRPSAERPNDCARKLDRVDEILARHFIVDAERIPTHRPVRLPLQLAISAGYGSDESLAGLRVAPLNRSRAGVAGQKRNLHYNAASWVDRQERGIARRALFSKARQHDFHHCVVSRQHMQQRGVKAAGGIIFGRRGEFIFETEGVEKRPQSRVIVRAKTVMRAERIGHAGERLAQMWRDQLLIGDVVRDFCSPSMSSEKASSFVAIRPSVRTSKAWRTMPVRATSPNVPMCGRPEGP